MAISTTRLDRFISDYCQVNRKSVRLMLAQKRVYVDGLLATDIGKVVDKFSYITMDNEVLQANKAHYIMLNKPIGVVCATKDEKHKTVIDLLVDKFDDEITTNLHIVGRLDLNTSGLVLLTNDSRWSERLTSPEHKVAKCYQVTLEDPLTAEYISAFANGMYFSYEEITTQPAKLLIISTYQAQVTLTEGRYHQIKRMFGRFRNKVVALHRHSIGQLSLDEGLSLGESRVLTADEVVNVAD
ncbi:16S rRNA pseudouridine(516) synthase [Colwellia psychrerythraea]|uniref:Pseudouridine synthase n=1 Tax=Colwellia psychrerythraea TaxID=28229 RepID=A0A099KMN7_COLPS|nr:16S rRNA pseudouridine(516) synthase [Colwellia psychrerythraea]KGJ91162.1 pseudouridine synthase Rsu [Colwellia psychrerythraea]